jgi:hypothetical protein
MRPASLLAAALICVPAPALASASFECEATDGSGIAIVGNMARAIAAPLNAVILRIGERILSTATNPPQILVAQSWLDSRELKVDLVDPRMERFEAQLRVRIDTEGEARGTLVRNGRSHPVRCEFG